MWGLLALPAGAQDRSDSAEVLFAPTHDKRLVQERICREIAAARHEIVVAVYQFTSRQLAEALVRAQQRGVEVRVLLDGNQVAEGGAFAEAVKTLANGKVSVRKVFAAGRDKKGKSSARFHHKFCVIDGNRLLTGSYNWTVQGDTDNHENVLLLSNRDLAHQYETRFETIWQDSRITE